MKPSGLLLCLAAIIQVPLISSQQCNYIALVKCMIEVLDEWALTLYELKNNAATISKEKCVHVDNLRKCVEDSKPEKHNCNKEDVIATSRSVSDLLTHQHDSGTFLKTYYLLQYPCSVEGQKIIAEHKDCLNDERISPLTMSAATYLAEKYIVPKYQRLKSEKKKPITPEEACTHLKDRISQYNTALEPICAGGGARFMCKSLEKMIKGVYEKETGNCEIDCTIASPLPSPEPDTELVKPSQAAEQTDNGKVAAGTVSPSLLQLGVVLVVAKLLA